MSALAMLEALGRASLVGGVAALAAGVTLTVLGRRVPSALRAWIWWLVAAHFAVAFIPAQAVVVPSTTPAPVPVLLTPARTAAEQTGVITARVAEGAVATGRVPRFDVLVPLAIGAWLLGVAVSLLLQLRDLRRIERAWSAAAPYRPSEEEAVTLERARGGSLPEVRITSEFDVALTLFGPRPRILLPHTCLPMPPESRRLVLAHECAHVERRDLLLGCLPAVTEALFWFHPLARWAVREYGQAREEACDAHALSTTQASARSYGEVLIRFGVAPRCIPSTASCGSPTRGALLRRLLMLDSRSSLWGRLTGMTLIAVAALSLAPLRLQAHDNDESSDSKSRVPAKLEIERFAYLLVEPGGNNMGGAMRTGNGYNDPERARKAQKKLGGGRIWWFRLDGANYALDDPETIASVRAVYEKEDELESRMLRSYDERLDALARRMELLHPKMERLDARRQALEKEREALEDARADGKSVGELEATLRKLTVSLEEIERSYEPISSDQEQISREMEELTQGREKAYREWEKQELEYRSQLRQIAEDAVRNGVARKL
jgi:beta-lactamase regulating signal transducer with metallopeptidase domain